ncbi:MAG: MFS transporter [Candidatus Aenigmarchaeota archaeon]|nr:MFS transporter [Candidatus Aenigmarchaeota archaeon]
MQFGEYIKFTGISVWFLFSIYLFNPVLSPYVKSLGFNDIQISILFSLLPISIIIFSPVMGSLSDSVGRKKIVLLGIFIEIMAILLYLVGTPWPIIAAAKILDAIGVVTVSLVTLAKIEDTLDGSKRGKYTGWSLSARYLGTVLGPVVGATLANIFSMKAPFVTSVILLVILFLFVLQKENESIKRSTSISLNPIKEIKEFISVKKLQGMGILGIVMHATNPAIQIFLPLFILEKLGLGIEYVGYAYFFLTFMHLFQFKFGELSDRYGSWRIVIIGCIISAIGIMLMGFSPNFIILSLILVLRGIGNSMWNVSAWNLMSDVGEKMKKEGTITTSYISLAKIGSFASFLFSGLIVMMFGMRFLFILNGLIILMGIVISYPLLRCEI